jgi:predicted nuclease with TOPRIM domain
MTDQRSDRTNVKSKLDDCREQIAELSQKLKTAAGTEAEALRPKLKAAQEHLRELKETSAEAWEDLKPGLRKAWGELHDSLSQATSRFKARPKE